MYQRDPLSAAYDQLAAALAAWGQAHPWAGRTVLVRSPGGDLVDGGGLSRHERAFQRSVYRALNSTGITGPHGGAAMQNPDWSLMRRWGEPSFARVFLVWRWGERQRPFWFMVTPKSAGRQAAPGRGELWVSDPSLQSGGQGSVKQRFP